MSNQLDLAAITACVRQKWSLEIGDPTIAGWVTVIAYALCVVLAFLTLERANGHREKMFWAMIMLAMLFLGINKQLDLQSLLTATGRCMSQLQGWYEERRGFQRHFIMTLFAVAILFVGAALWFMRKHLKRNSVALIGLGIVTAFIVIRAVGFHHFDALIKSEVQDVRFNVMFELSGLALIAGNAVVLLLRSR